MYDGMKKAFGPSVNKIAPLKPAAERGKQMERWTEHYQELYSSDTVTDAATENTTNLPVTEKLNKPPIEEELDSH